MKNTFEKRVIVSFVLVWGILVLNSIEAASREWHVSLSGNDNDSGTLEFPLRHIQYAANKAQPGDKVIIRCICYQSNISRCTDSFNSLGPNWGGVGNSVRTKS